MDIRFDGFYNNYSISYIGLPSFGEKDLLNITDNLEQQLALP